VYHAAGAAVLAGALTVAAVVLGADGAAAAPPKREASGPIREPGFDGFIDSSTLAEVSAAALPGAFVRVLSAEPGSGRSAHLARFPSGYRLDPATTMDALSMELIVLSGRLAFGSETLHEHDFAFLPSGLAMPVLASERGATALVFFDPVSGDGEAIARQRARGVYVTRYDPAKWRPGIVARDAGQALKLEVQDLKRDPDTTARTWLVRAGPNLSVPWERHSVVEEGYLIAGDYRIAECLASGHVVGNYAKGGYFRRAQGILHSGPESGTKQGVVWLLRSPAALDVRFEDVCSP